MLIRERRNVHDGRSVELLAEGDFKKPLLLIAPCGFQFLGPYLRSVFRSIVGTRDLGALRLRRQSIEVNWKKDTRSSAQLLLRCIESSLWRSRHPVVIDAGRRSVPAAACLSASGETLVHLESAGRKDKSSPKRGAPIRAARKRDVAPCNGLTIGRSITPTDCPCWRREAGGS